LLWLLGIPLPIIILLALFGRYLHSVSHRNSKIWRRNLNRVGDLLSAQVLNRKETPMLQKLALASAAIMLLCSTASADYYIVQEKATKKCKVVETRPTETTWIQIGPAAFKTKDEADKQVAVVCKEKM
jgi:hypothetical protein